MSYTICSRFKGEHIVYAGYTICTSREHIVYGAFCGSTGHIYELFKILSIKHRFCVRKRNVSMRRFYNAHKTCLIIIVFFFFCFFVIILSTSLSFELSKLNL